MCGIAGVFQLRGEPASAVLARRMADAIAHRGPDAEGIFTDGPVSFGHRRLSIIDTSSAGQQPMATPDGRFVLNYNGEIYNFQELRTELQASGIGFRSRSDTEVALQALALWGTSALERFNGMFALALWDRHEKSLLLARDRYGIKPLYYTVLTDGTFLFASEIKAFLKHPGFRAELDPEILVEYLTFQNVFTEGTLFRRVKLLPQGSFARLGMGADRVDPIRYWNFSFREPDASLPSEEYEEELDRLFRQAVSRQLVSDVDVGSYLSGGIDSGSITAIASQQIPDLRTFTVGFDMSSVSGIEATWDEREKAEHLSYLFKTEHYEMVLKAGDMERSMRKLIWHLEDPRVGQSYPNFYAAKLASRFGKVVLSGAGGDEMFAGYPWRYYRASQHVPFETFVDDYYRYWQRLVDNRTLKKLVAPIEHQTKSVWTRDIVRDVFVERPAFLERASDFINLSLYFEARTFLHGLLLVEDKLSMAHGLETRVPFLDNDLVDFAMQTPIGLKLGNVGPTERINENEPKKQARFYEKTRDGKLLLRQVLSRHVPDEVSNRTKQGFAAPDSSWFRGESIDYVERLLFHRDAIVYDYLDRGTVRNLVLDHLEGRSNRRLLIWSLICLEEWCGAFLTGADG